MSNIYEVFNVTNDYELSKVFDKLDLSYNEMTNIDYIVESMNKENARNKILEIMAGSADGNYEVCLEQFAKTIKKRVLKEESGLNLNQIMELNQLVELVASKLSANQQQCLEGIYNIISQKAGVNAAKTFIGMVQQSSVNQSSLKFNTDLVVDGKNLAQVIYALKNEIEIFCNSVKKEESEKEEVKESVNDYSMENHLAGVYNVKNGSFREGQNNLSEEDFRNRLVRYNFQDTDNGKVCYITAWSYADAFNTRGALKKKYPNENVEKWRLEWFQNGDGSWNRPLKRYVEIIGKDGQNLNESYESYKHIIQELDKAVDDVSDINVLKSIAERVNTLLGKVKNMNEANEIASLKTTIETKMNSLMDVKPQLEECCLATQVAQDVCGEDTFNGLLDSVKPTVINITVNKEDNGILPCLDNCCDVPCCDVPCSDVPCNDCENTDIAPIVQPMNFEPTAIDAPILRKPNSAEVTSAITALSSHTNDIKSDSRENNLENLQTINTLLGQISNYFNTLLGESFDIGDKITKDLEDKNEKIESLWDGEEDEQLDEETVYDHSWFEVEGQKYPKRTKNGVEGLPIKEMSNFEEFDSLIVENYRQYAGILDLNDNSLFYLPQGEIHHNYIKESDVFNGKVRFGVAEYRGKVVGYISSDSREHMMKALKILKRELSSAPISYWMVEYFEDGQRVRMNIDDNGRTVYENKNDWFPAWGNAKKLVETCSAGACCAASVATVPSKPKKAKSKPRKQESFDVSLFKESVRNDCPVTLTINDKMVSYKLVEGKGYLYIDNGIVKTLDKDVMLETIDDVYNNCLDIDVLEGYNAYELNILLEDELNSDMGDVDSVTTITPDEKKKAQTELDNNLSQKPNAKINVVSSENNGEIHQNQEFIGIDDHDESNKKYIVKDPATGKITVADYNQIKIAEN